MDVAFNQHSSHARRKNRSSTNLNHLTLAPLTTKLPLADPEELAAIQTAPPAASTSYLQGKSAPTTPRLLSHSPARSRSQSRRVPVGSVTLAKSKSTTHLHRKSTSGTATPTASNGHRHHRTDDNFGVDPNDSDWLLRAGAMLSGEYREYKGQAWLETRASSTNLVGTHTAAPDAEELAFEQKMAREYHGHSSSSRHQSRRGSVQILEDESIYMTATSSPPGSRLPSRSQSRLGSRTQLMTPRERRSLDGYFNGGGHHQVRDEDFPGPDFVNLDEMLEAVEQDTSIEDDAHVRRLVKKEKQDGAGAWFGSVLGWNLFSVEENDEETDDEDYDESDAAGESGRDASPDDDVARLERRRSSGIPRFEGITTVPEARVPPPKANEGGWQDAAWLLSVASKVLL